MNNQYHIEHSDVIKFLNQLDNESIDLVITDPPYESLEKHRRIGTTTRLKKSKASSNEWFKIFPNSQFPELFQELYRVLRKNRHFYLFCDPETMFIAKPVAEAAGFRFWKPLVWDKVAIGMGYHYRARYEFILFFEKGKRKLADLSVPDILEHKRIRGGHPAEKPVELLETLVRQSTLPNELVCDPFMGSGSAGIAAIRQGRQFIGCDLAMQSVTWTQERIDIELTQNMQDLSDDVITNR
ncbi:site-specific DNA-methyltransferase [Leptothoe sp. EHU-05/26/07-4]